MSAQEQCSSAGRFVDGIEHPLFGQVHVSLALQPAETNLRAIVLFAAGGSSRSHAHVVSHTHTRQDLFQLVLVIVRTMKPYHQWVGVVRLVVQRYEVSVRRGGY